MKSVRNLSCTYVHKNDADISITLTKKEVLVAFSHGNLI